MTSRTFDLVDQLLDGTLAARLREWRADGLSLREITTRLDADHGVYISHETIRAWLADIERPQ